jgi:hypothetical protein
MKLAIIKDILSMHQYLIVIKCTTNKYFKQEYIPSFITDKTVAYFIKSHDDLNDIIREIFLIWRYKFHSNPSIDIRTQNLAYMEQIKSQTHNLKYLPYLDFNIRNDNLNTNVNCWFRVYSMREEFTNFLDLSHGNYITNPYKYKLFNHKIIPHIIYKDLNPNRLRVHISQNQEYITKGINQTFLTVINTNDSIDAEFYKYHLGRLNLTIKNPLHFEKLISSDESFVMTEDDFELNDQILYARIYFIVSHNKKTLI